MVEKNNYQPPKVCYFKLSPESAMMQPTSPGPVWDIIDIDLDNDSSW